MIKRWIEVQIVKEGVHCYPSAGTDPKLADVRYLANEHMHYFYITVKLEVFHNDRDLEFQQFKRYLGSLYTEEILKMDHKSCEMLAEELIEVLKNDTPNRDMIVRVFEDNINGAELEYTKE
jgi:hypothetical protein